MADVYGLANDPSGPSGGRPGPSIVIQNLPPRQPWLGKMTMRILLLLSVMANFALMGLYSRYYPNVSSNEQFKEGDQFAKDKIALISVHGMITGESVRAPIKELKVAEEDKDVRAVILLIDSPGGTISGSDELHHAIVQYKKKTQRPVVVSMQGMATSGGYYISAPADLILAERSTITGSIGVIASLMNFEELLKRWGVASEVVKSGKMKDSGSPFRAMTPEERQEWQKLIDAMFAQFLRVVLDGREKKVGGEEKLRKLADGRIYLAEEAKSLGLIDEIGYTQDAIESAKKLAGLSGEVRVVHYARPFGDLRDLFGVSRPGEKGVDASELMRGMGKLLAPQMYYLPASFLPMTAH